MDGHVYRTSDSGGGGARRGRAGGEPDRHRAIPPHCRVPDLTGLVRAVEAEVIPRLLKSHRAPAPHGGLPSLDDVEALAERAINSDADGAMATIEELRARGIGLEAIYINLLGAAARLLGEEWEQDRLGFFEVTMGLCTLHQVLFRLAPPERRHSDGAPVRRVLLAPVPGEDHVFGALIVARFFNEAGWRTWTETAIERDTLASLVARENFDVVGLSIACDIHRDGLFDSIRAMRELAPGTRVMIGGHACQVDPALATRVGADATATDPSSAVQIAESLAYRGAVGD